MKPLGNPPLAELPKISIYAIFDDIKCQHFLLSLSSLPLCKGALFSAVANCRVSEADVGHVQVMWQMKKCLVTLVLSTVPNLLVANYCPTFVALTIT